MVTVQVENFVADYENLKAKRDEFVAVQTQALMSALASQATIDSEILEIVTNSVDYVASRRFDDRLKFYTQYIDVTNSPIESENPNITEV